MNARPQTRKLAFEQCENREMMAGNVQVFTAGDQLYILGDQQNNVIEVTEIGNNYVQVKATFGTTVNGGSLAYFYNPNDNLKVFMNGGDDTLMISSNVGRVTSFNNVNVDMGQGKDYLGFWGIHVSQNATFVMGTDGEYDADTLSIGRNPFNANTPTNWFFGNVNIRTGGGDDSVTFRESSYIAKTLDLRTGSENDTVVLDRVSADSFYADLGQGNDGLNAWGLTVRGSATILAGAYDNDLYFGSLDYLNPRNNSGFERVNRW